MFPVSIKTVFCSPAGEVVLLMNERDEWELPGGRIEIGEAPMACVEREVREELGLLVSVEELLDTYLFEVIPGKHVFIATYSCTLTGRFEPRISDEHTRIGLFHPDALPRNLPDGYRSSIAKWRLGALGRPTAGDGATILHPATPMVVSLRYIAHENDPEKLGKIVTGPVERIVLTLERVTQTNTSTTHGRVDVEVGFLGGATEQDLAAVRAQVEMLNFGDAVEIVSCLAELRLPHLSCDAN